MVSCCERKDLLTTPCGSLLLKLPPEIITQIFYYVPDAPDVYRLALSCKRLFSIFQYEMSYHLDYIRLEYLNNQPMQFNSDHNKQICGFSCSSKNFNSEDMMPPRENRLIELFSRTDPSCPEKVMMSYDHYFEKRNLMYKKAYMDKLPDIPDMIESKEHLMEDMLENVPLAVTPFQEDHQEEDEKNDENEYEEEEDIRSLRRRAKPNVKTLYEMTLSSFERRMQKILRKNPLARITLQCLFDFNRAHTTSNKTQFVVAGGFILHVLTKCGSCDIDIFCINNGENEVTVDNALKAVLIEIEKRLRRENMDYRLLKTNGTLNLLPKTDGNREITNKYPDARTRESKLSIQFVLRKVKTIEELMCFFDIDCCRFCYDGQQVFTILEGLRALRHRLNFVAREHIQTGMYMDRAVKYSRRGFQTLCVDFKHPLQHNLHIQPFIDWLRNFIIENYIEQDGEPNYDHELMGDEMWNGFGTLAPYMYFFHNYSDSRDLDESNYYTVVLKSLDYWLVECILKNGVKNALDYFLENGDYSDGRWTANFKKIQVTPLNYKDDVIDGIIRHIQEDVHYFCRNITDLLSKHRAIFITEGYLDSHLIQKYHFYKCYICGKYSHNSKNIHFCRDCHKFNGENKLQILNHGNHLQGKVAIVTGGRIKIGYETSKLLLEKGATTIVTTRFPHNALKKFQAETNYSKWKDNLIIYPLNLKDGKSIISFTEFVKSKFSHVDILINNAAQTVRRPVTYYKPLVEIEKQNADKPLPLSTATIDKKNDTSSITEIQQLTSNLVNDTLRITLEERLPEDIEHKPSMNDKDKWGEPLDTRTLNSWNMKLPEISSVEILECQMINNIAPTILISQLTDVLKPKCTNDIDFNDPLTMYSFIINVTSHEGQFSATGKTDCHIHTNMSKASLNMLTRSGANFYAKFGVLMNSVDTGWVSSAISTFKEPPLTAQDAACRILHPILSGSFEYGKLFKDYRVVDW